MANTIPVEAFSELPVMISDLAGEVAYCNRAAQEFFGCDDCVESGRKCWEVARFRRPDGSAFCEEDCPVRRLARTGTMVPRHVVSRSRRREPPLDVELLTFPIPHPSGNGDAVLHLIMPGLARRPAARTAGGEPLKRLSPRESEILGLLARGLGTVEVAERLFISPTTVRNHVQHILEKLEVHGRLDAILTYLRRPR